MGAATGILSGGVTLVGGAVAGGAVAGTLFHKSLGLSDEDKARLEERLKQGGAAIVVMADEDEVKPTQAELTSLGGQVEDYMVEMAVASGMREAAEDLAGFGVTQVMEGVVQIGAVTNLDDEAEADK